jgi:hypothetical protein
LSPAPERDREREKEATASSMQPTQGNAPRADFLDRPKKSNFSPWENPNKIACYQKELGAGSKFCIILRTRSCQHHLPLL